MRISIVGSTHDAPPAVMVMTGSASSSSDILHQPGKMFSGAIETEVIGSTRDAPVAVMVMTGSALSSSDSFFLGFSDVRRLDDSTVWC